MTKFSSMRRARLPRLIGVLVVIPACVFGTGYFVVSSLAAPASPAPTLTSHPANPSSSSSSTFAFTSSKTPTAFLCSLGLASFTTCTSPVTYTGLADGRHTFRVEARYGSGATATTGGPTSYSWQVIPAAPAIVSGPSNPSADPSPKFTFSDANWPNINFSCGLDSLPHLGCTLRTALNGVEGQAQFSNLARGNHCFYVLAVDLLGIQSLVTKFCWTIVAPLGFTVGGSPSAALYPGTSQPINLTFTNPNTDPITIPSGGIAASNIAITSNAPGCASSNFTITQGLTTSVTIPARQSMPVSLSTLGVPQADWPVIEMIETHKNQDVCENAKLTLTYSRIEATG
jgi:hypothetical protein